MRKKAPIPFSQKFPNADPLALRLLERLLAFDHQNRPSAEEVHKQNTHNYLAVNSSILYVIICCKLTLIALLIY